MKLNFKKLTMLTIATFILFTAKVNAQINVKAENQIQVNNQTVYKYYDNLSTGEKNIISKRSSILELEIDGKIYTAYCIDFGINNVTGSDANTHDLYAYFQNVLDQVETKELVKKITLYAKYGYGYNGKNSSEYYLATQQLIWEAINDAGFYQSNFYKERAGQKYNLANFGWTIDQKNKIDMSKEINKIKEDVNKHYITPSFCNNTNKLEVELGKAVTYTDTNKVLSSYKVVCDTDLECEKDGNNLTVAAKNNAGNKKIEFIKEASGTENVLYRVGERQSLISSTGIVETVMCEFGINSFKNVQTSDTKIIYVAITGLFSAIIAYVIRKVKHI